MKPERLAKLRVDARNGNHISFSPAVVQDLLAEIDRLTVANDEMQRRIQNAQSAIAKVNEALWHRADEESADKGDAS